MAGSICHIAASVLLLAASILLLVASISAPVVNHIGILVVKLPEDAKGDEITFGTFGYCIEHGGDNRDDLCPSARLGYSPLDTARALNILTATTYLRTTTRGLTRIMILHPVAAALSALAFVFALATPALGTSLACLFSTAAFLAVALAMVSDFVLFGMVRAAVNQDGRAGSSAAFGVAMWCVLVAAVCAFVGTLLVLGSCCAGRSGRRRKRDAEKAGESASAPVTPAADPAADPTADPAADPTADPTADSAADAAAAPAEAPEMAPADGAAKPKRRFWRRG